MRPKRRLSSRSRALSVRLLGGVAGCVLHCAVPRLGQAQPCEGLCWSAPVGCPSQRDVMARIQQLAEGRFVFEGRGWVARVTELAGAWQLELSHGEYRRDIAAPNCAALAEAAAVAIVLSEPPGVNDPTSAVPGEPSVAGLAPSAPEVSSVERGSDTASVDWVQTEPSPTPRASALAERSEAERPPGRQTEPRRVEHRAPLNAPKAAPTESATTAPEHDASWLLAATGFWDSSLIPGGSLGAQLGAGYQWAPQQRAVAFVLLLQPRRKPIETASDVSVDYTYAAGTVRACWSSATRLVLEGCTGVEVGAMSAQTLGFADGQSQRSVFPSFVLTLGGGAAAGPVQLRFASEGIVPLLRDRFTADNGVLLVHETPRLSVRLGAGILWPF